MIKYLGALISGKGLESLQSVSVIMSFNIFLSV
jgi:hypothetical protein